MRGKFCLTPNKDLTAPRPLPKPIRLHILWLKDWDMERKRAIWCDLCALGIYYGRSSNSTGGFNVGLGMNTNQSIMA